MYLYNCVYDLKRAGILHVVSEPHVKGDIDQLLVLKNKIQIVLINTKFWLELICFMKLIEDDKTYLQIQSKLKGSNPWPE